MQHILDAYKDGFQWVTFCKICGDENPTGDCVGKFVPHGERNNPSKLVSNLASDLASDLASKSVDNSIDNKLKCE